MNGNTRTLDIVPQAAHDDKLLLEGILWNGHGWRGILSRQWYDKKSGKYRKRPVEEWKNGIPQDRPRTALEMKEARATRPNANLLQVMRPEDVLTIDIESEEAFDRVLTECKRRKIDIDFDEIAVQTTPSGGRQFDTRLNGFRPPEIPRAQDLEILTPGSNPSAVFGPGRTWNVLDPWNFDRRPWLTKELWSAIEAAILSGPPCKRTKGLTTKAVHNIKEYSFMLENTAVSFLRAFKGVKEGARILGIDGTGWELGKGCSCLFPYHSPDGVDSSPSAAWYRADDGVIVYHDFHGGGFSCIAPVALYCHAFHQDPESYTVGKSRLGVFLAGMEKLLEAAEEPESGIYRRRALLTRALNAMQADREIRELFGRTALLAELYHHATGGDFALPVRHLAAFLGAKTPNGNEDIRKANRAINFLCVIGYLGKTGPRGSWGKCADRYTFSVPDYAVCGRIGPVNIDSVLKMNRWEAYKVIGERVNAIYRAAPERKKEEQGKAS